MRKAVLRDKNDGRGPSPELWYACPWTAMLDDPNLGVAFFDDFTDKPVSGGRYGFVEADAGSDIDLLTTEVGGVLRLAVTTTDNNEASLASGGNEAGLVKFVTNSGNRLWWEARIRVSSVANNVCGIAIGLFEEATAIADIQADDTAALADKDYVGFRTLQADGDGLDAVHNTASGSGEVVVQELAETLVAATWVKVGLYFDGVSTVSFFVDGVVVDTCETDDTDFPDGEELCMLIAGKVGSAATENLDMDWWRIAAEI